MTQNVLNIWGEIYGIVGGAVALIIFAVTIAIKWKPRKLPGISGHRDKSETTDTETIHPDGYIDGFAGVIEEAGGGLPPILWVTIPGIILWWLLTLIFFWTPR